MYLKHWGLDRPPFPTVPTSQAWTQGAAHTEALARLRFLADQGQRVGIVLGESGVGKSTLLEVFARRRRRLGDWVVTIPLLGCDHHEFLWRFGDQLGCGSPPESGVATLWRNIQDRMATLLYQRNRAVILLDDADECDVDVLAGLVRLTQWPRHASAQRTWILTSQAQRQHLLGSRLRDLCSLRIDVQPWEEAETVAYLRWAFERAGRAEPPLSAAAMLRIHELSGGLPRRVNQLADLSLLVAASHGQSTIEPDAVDSVCDELTLAKG